MWPAQVCRHLDAAEKMCVTPAKCYNLSAGDRNHEIADSTRTEANMGDTRQHPGGIRLANEGERLGFLDLNRMGDLENRSILHLLAEMLFDTGGSQPLDGFFTDGCEVTSSGGLNYSVAPGYGLRYDSAEIDDWLSHYKVIANIATYNGTFAAHEASPRWDVVSMAPATTDDKSETDGVRNPATGTVTLTSIYTRRRWSRTLTVTKGTAAAVPAVPATPAGHIKIAEVWVPAVAGDVVVHDVRPRLFLGQDLARGLAGEGAASDCVLGSGDQLLVKADGGGMYVFVDPDDDGCVMYGGHRYHGAPGRKTIAAADPAQDRIDLVEVHYEGYLTVSTGTPGAPPSAPPPTGDGVVLAEVYVTAAAAVINPGDVTDRRERAFIGTPQLLDESVTEAKLGDDAVTEDKVKDGEVTAAKLSVRPTKGVMSSSGPSTSIFTITIDTQDLDGVNQIGQFDYLLELMEASDGVQFFFNGTVSNGSYLADNGSGSGGSGSTRCIVRHTAGVASDLEVEVETTIGGPWLFTLVCTPVNTPGAVTHLSVSVT